MRKAQSRLTVISSRLPRRWARGTAVGPLFFLFTPAVLTAEAEVPRQYPGGAYGQVFFVTTARNLLDVTFRVSSLAVDSEKISNFL